MLQTQVNYWNLVETERHNKESERLGFETLEETKRHNLKTEELTGRQIDLGFANLELGYSQLAEQQRHSMVTEAQGATSLNLGYMNAYETARAHRASEGIQAQQNAIALANLGELERHNKSVESTNSFNAVVGSQNASTNQGNLGQRRYEFNNSYQQRQQEINIAQQNANIAQQNANTNATNAKTNQWNATTNMGNMFFNGFKVVTDAIGNFISLGD